jgi:hypothetical protein
MLEIKASPETRPQAALFLGIMLLGIAIALYLYFTVDRYSLLYYWDSVSHLVAGRKIVDWGENPGLGQIGTVWMPLPHLLLLPFSLIDPLFTTGFAGLAVSLPCIAMTSILLYRTVKAQVGRRMPSVPTYIAIIAGLLFAMNPNILYLGLVSMTEAPFMLFFTASAYYLQKWYQSNGDKLRYLLLCAIFVSLASSCRYEGWLLPLFVAGISILYLVKKGGIAGKKNMPENDAHRLASLNKKKMCYVALMSGLSFSGVVFWLAWNQYHYDNPFQFASEKYYSASWYALNRPFREALFLQPVNALSTYSVSIIAMYGPILAGLAVVGFIFRRGYEDRGSNILYSFLAVPPVFTIVSLIIGIGELSYWFNSRFLVLLSPIIILLSCNVLKWLHTMQIGKDYKKVLLGALVVSLFAYHLLLPVSWPGIIVLNDATGGYNVKDNRLAIKTGEVLKSAYDGRGKIMVLTGSGVEQRIMITSGIPLKQFDEIIEGSSWKASYKEPWSYDRWMIISKHPAADAQNVTQHWLDGMDKINQHYDTIYENEIYKMLVLKS